MESRDSRTFYAVIIGFALILSAVLIGGASHFFNLQGLLIVCGGTLGATLLTFSLDELQQAISSLKRSLFDHQDQREERVQTILQLSKIARREGVLALEPLARRQHDQFLKRAIELVIDRVSEDDARRIMNLEIQFSESAENRAAELFRTMGTIAPAIGLVGTLIGLVQMLNHLDNPASLGPAMATALLTTFYGAIFAHMVCLPAAGKLQRSYEQDLIIRGLTAEGIIAICAGTNPRIIEEHIVSSAKQSSLYAT